MLSAHLVLPLLLAAPGSCQGVHVELPPGPAARAFSLVEPGLAPARLPAPASADPLAWRGEEPWRAWAAAVRASTAVDGKGASEARVHLARIALSQGRSDDAWDRLAALGADPAVVQALLPAFLPGIQPEQWREAEGKPLPDGILLSPALPPAPVPAGEIVRGLGRLDPRAMQIDGLRVGAATLSMRVALESDGVHVELTHTGGGPARLRVRLPVPVDFSLRGTYLDWEAQADPGVPIEVELAPGGEPRALFARLHPRALTWTTRLPAELTAGMRDPGLLVLAHEIELAKGFAAGLAALLEVPAEASAELPAPARPAWAGLLLDLRDPGERARKLAGLMSLAEQYALERPRAPR